MLKIVCCALLGLAAAQVKLRTGGQDDTLVSTKRPKCEGFIEELKVVGDGAAYVSEIYVGYKKFTCLPDTGSFDLEIIGSDAEKFNGTGYDRKLSKFHRRFPIP